MVQISRRAVLLGGAAASMIRGFCPSRVHAEDSARPSLPIPPELRASAEGTIALDARPGSMSCQLINRRRRSGSILIITRRRHRK